MMNLKFGAVVHVDGTALNVIFVYDGSAPCG
jgi:hypothetical protein